MIRADGSDDGIDPSDNTVARSWDGVHRELANTEVRLRAAAATSRLNSGVVFIPAVAADQESRFLMELTDAMTRPLTAEEQQAPLDRLPGPLEALVGRAEVTINSWRTRDCGDECSQQGSGSVYHYEEAELSNGDTIEINYRIAPNQSTRFLTPDAIHQYLRRIVERERGRAEDRLADLEMIERRLP